jgi:hypothetical protein
MSEEKLPYIHSDMSDSELKNALLKLHEWGISTGRLLGEGKIQRIDDRHHEMVQNTFDKFSASFLARARREVEREIQEVMNDDRQN